MKKLSKEQIYAHAALTVRLERAKTDLVLTQDALTAATEKYNTALELYNAVLTDADSFRDEVLSNMDDYIEGRSERWAESDAGESYNSWHDQWADLDLDPIDQMDLPEFSSLDQPDEWDELPEMPE